MLAKQLGLKTKNISILYTVKFIAGLLFFLPILALYLEKGLFNLTNVALIFSIHAFASVVFEVPTGAIADLFGRKKTIILAHFTMMFALIFLYIGGSMIMFLLYAIIFAFARSLQSGTVGAFIYDTLKDENKTNFYKKAKGTTSAFAHAGRAVGSIIGGYLALVSLSFPVLITFFPLTIATLLTFFLKEPKYEKEEHRNVLKHMVDSLHIIKKSKQLIILMFGLLILAAIFETISALSPIFYEFKSIPIQHFGWISAAIFGLSSMGFLLSHSFSEKFGNKTALLLTVITVPITLIIATYTDGYIAILFFILSPLFFGLRMPIIDYLVNVEVESKKRATVSSTAKLFERFGYALLAPLVGHLAGLWTINIAFRLSALLLFVIPILYFFLKDRK